MIIRLNGEGTDIKGADFSGQSSPTEDGDDASTLQTDASTVKQRRCRTTTNDAASASSDGAPKPTTGEVENPAPFEKKFSFLRKEQVEPGEIDLLFIHFHLSKVRVVGEIGRKILRKTVFHIEAGVTCL